MISGLKVACTLRFRLRAATDSEEQALGSTMHGASGLIMYLCRMSEIKLIAINPLCILLTIDVEFAYSRYFDVNDSVFKNYGFRQFA